MASGADKLINQFNQFDAKLQQAAKNAIEDSATFLQEEAVKMAPELVRQRIDKRPTREGFGFEIGVFLQLEGGLPGDLAAYLEFGTGASAEKYVPTLPKAWQKLASLFIVNKLGRTIKHPYLYPAFVKTEPFFKETLLEEIKKALK